ncbi:MAG: exopolysaccharide biosynthesis protein [Phycisphaerales bacterium]
MSGQRPNQPHASDPENLEGVIDRVLDSTEGENNISVGDVLDAFSDRLFGPLLVVPALALISPIGAIPGAPIVFAVLLTLLAGQKLIGLDRPWLPRRLTQRSVRRGTLEDAMGKLRPWAKRIDTLIRPRLTVLATGPATYAAAALVVVLAIAIVPIGLIPFAVAAPGGAILLIGLALTARDGVLTLIALALAAASGWLVLSAVG